MRGAIVTQITIFEQGHKEAENVTLKLNENYLNVPAVSKMKRISKFKGRIQQIRGHQK